MKDVTQRVLATAKKKDVSSSVLLTLLLQMLSLWGQMYLHFLASFFRIFPKKGIFLLCSTLHASPSRFSVLTLKMANLCCVNPHHFKVLQSSGNSFKISVQQVSKRAPHIIWEDFTQIKELQNDKLIEYSILHM